MCKLCLTVPREERGTGCARERSMTVMDVTGRARLHRGPGEVSGLRRVGACFSCCFECV